MAILIAEAELSGAPRLFTLRGNKIWGLSPPQKGVPARYEKARNQFINLKDSMEPGFAGSTDI
jgi:hypothetical protein